MHNLSLLVYRTKSVLLTSYVYLYLSLLYPLSLVATVGTMARITVIIDLLLVQHYARSMLHNGIPFPRARPMT